MESKLALYQLAAPQLGGCTSCRSAMSVPIKQWNYSFDNIMNRFTQLVGAAGSVNNLINAFRSGQDVPGTAGMSEEDRKFYLQMEQANIKNGGGNAGNEAMMQFLTQMQQQNAAMLQAIANRSSNETPKPEKDNTPLYIGLGVGGVVILMMMVMMMKKS